MKTRETMLAVLLLMAVLGCRQEPRERKTQMALDSAIAGANVTIVHPRDTLRPSESLSNFKELSTVMQYDVDAARQLPSKEVVYVKPGEPLRPSEKRD